MNFIINCSSTLIPSSTPLSVTMNYLLQSLRSKERSDAFITIGLLSIALDGNMKSYLPKILEFVRAALPSKVIKKILIILLF